MLEAEAKSPMVFAVVPSLYPGRQPMSASPGWMMLSPVA